MPTLKPNQSLSISIFENPSIAPKYDNKKVTAVHIDEAVIIGNGTLDNNPTVDFQLSDAKGNQYVVMITGKLIESLSDAIAGVR